MQSKFKRILVTAALPYANGPIHLGHLAGAYIPADIFVRYQRLQHREVLFICGSDEHGVPITITADKEGVSPQVIVENVRGDLEEPSAELVGGAVGPERAVDFDENLLGEIERRLAFPGHAAKVVRQGLLVLADDHFKSLPVSFEGSGYECAVIRDRGHSTLGY